MYSAFRAQGEQPSSGSRAAGSFTLPVALLCKTLNFERCKLFYPSLIYAYILSKLDLNKMHMSNHANKDDPFASYRLCNYQQNPD